MAAVVALRPTTDFQSADWLYALYAHRTLEALDAWVEQSASPEERRIKRWLIYGFYCTRETDLIRFAQRQKGEAPYVRAG